MSVVDQRVWLAAGRVRRLLVRVLLVLGGAFAVTVIGWLLCAGSANADELPAVPSVPSVLAGVDNVVAQVSTPDIPAAKLPSGPLSDPGLGKGLGKVAQQVHLAVTGVGDKVAPSIPPATDLVPSVVPVPKAPQPAEPATQPLAPLATTGAPPAPLSASPATTRLVQYRHIAAQSVQRPTPQRPAPVPSGVGPHLPLLPPLQPASSSDSSAHGAGGVAGGPGGAQTAFPHVLGNGLNLAGPPSMPRLAVAPGQQPGTSPD